MQNYNPMKHIQQKSFRFNFSGMVFFCSQHIISSQKKYFYIETGHLKRTKYSPNIFHVKCLHECVRQFVLPFFLFCVFAGVLFVPAASSSLGSVLISGFLSSGVDPTDVSIGSVLHSSPAGSSFFMWPTYQNKVRDGI